MKFLNQVIKAIIANREQQAKAYRQGYRYYY
jgi:ATPase subunit of ABC transporter with duplicated ATPase domains